MKTKIVSLLGMFLIGTMTLFAGTKTEKIKVNGNCDMCKARIEKAAKAVSGVNKAEWNKDTKVMELAFDDTKTNVHKVEMAIANVGYDTEMVKASDEAYNKLPGCCQYERVKSEMKMDSKKDSKMDMKMHEK